MTINNSKKIINLKLINRTSIILFLTFLVLTWVAKVIKYPLLGLNETIWTLIVLVIFLLIVFIPMMLNYQYVYYSDEGENITIRYYSVGIIPGNKNAVEINKRTFSGFSLDKKFFGLIQSITLYQRIREGVAKYPPIYINAIKSEQRVKMIKSLNSYAPVIKSKE
jgi:hypothetical protein